ncbi:MAG: glycogen synthase [Candidatus Omnitrophica bacterium]|nr:glycogen synthase [Candidatus Omnitrophota bacterium]
MNVAFCSSELFPFSKTGGLADVCGALPLALERLDIKISAFVPMYRHSFDDKSSLTEAAPNCFKTTIGETVDIYFIKNDAYYDRVGIYGEQFGDYPDNFERYLYFCESVLTLINQLGLGVDMIHCHDWQTALVPVLLRHKYNNYVAFQHVKTILTIHNLAFQGIFPLEKVRRLEFNVSQELYQQFEFYGQINLLKAGMCQCDEITTVSPQYAQEIQTQQYGCGLHQLLTERRESLVGILNGIDYSIWDPFKDVYLENPFDKDHIVDSKTINKNLIQRKLKLNEDPRVPLFGFVGRLTHQKGIDLILDMLADLDHYNIQVILQGIGNTFYMNKLNELAGRFPEKLGLCFEFDEQLAHQIYAGSDFFLMPSNFEPCGLSQMIALKYGTIPIVYKTGGLVDTIQPFDPGSKNGNGIVFDEHHRKKFEEAIQAAQGFYGDQTLMNRLIQNALASDFDWKHSAQAYKDLYQCLLSASQEI